MTNISTISELAIATRTNEPIVNVPQEFQSEITEVAVKYINLYFRRYTDKEVCGMMEILPIVRNRFENLTADGIAAGTISMPKDVSNLLKGNAMMEALEEKAIIEAYKNHVKNAGLYVQLFFSFKVYDFMRSSHLFGSRNEQDMYCSLQMFLYELVDKFDFDIVKNGGLAKNYYRQAMCDYVRENLLGKEYSMFSCQRRQVADLHRAQRITTEDSMKYSYEELAKKYGTTKVAVSLYFTMKNTVCLDSTVANSEGELSHNYDFIADNKNGYTASENMVGYDNMFDELEKGNIEKGVARSILAALLTYAENSEDSRGHIKKASKAIYKNIANEVGVPLKVVNTVIDTFSEMFA